MGYRALSRRRCNQLPAPNSKNSHYSHFYHYFQGFYRQAGLVGLRVKTLPETACADLEWLEALARTTGISMTGVLESLSPPSHSDPGPVVYRAWHRLRLSRPATPIFCGKY